MEAFLMVIYPPSNRSNATFEKPQWASNSNVEKEINYTQDLLEFESSLVDSQTAEMNTEKEAEKAADNMNVRFIMQYSNDIATYRQLEVSQ